MTDQLILREDELFQIRSSWSDLQTNSKSTINDFMLKLYSNLLTSNPELKSVFKEEDTIQSHAHLFGDMLNFSVSYIDDVETVEEFVYQFVLENQEFANASIQYLEPMGLAIVKTFKQSLGDVKFSSELESVWIKVYIYLANSILANVDGSESDSGSTFSAEPQSHSETESVEEPYVQPLNIKKAETEAEDVEVAPRAAPVAARPVTELDKANTIQFDIKGNEKYRGFRRNDQANTPQAEPISVKIPTNTTFQKVHAPVASSNMSASLSSMLASRSSSTASLSVYQTPPSTPFDPRKKRFGRSPVSSSASSINDDFEIPMKSPLRRRSTVTLHAQEEDSSSSHQDSVDEASIATVEEKHAANEPPSLLKKLQMRKPLRVVSSSEEEEEEDLVPQPKFDPRRRHKRNNSIQIPSPESSELDEQEESVLLKNNHDSHFSEGFDSASDVKNKQLPMLPAIPTPRQTQTYDYNSFGLRGLAPIVETNDDFDEKSSKYESDAASSNYAGEDSVNDRSSTDMASSGASTLSLHNSDYRSSISSGTETGSPVMNKFQMAGTTTRQSSQSSEVSYMNALPEPAQAISRVSSPVTSEQQLKLRASFNNTHNASTSSLLLNPKATSNSQSRVSLGFMRSSFVLKKEMETLGYNQPENVLVKPPTIPAAMGSTVSLLPPAVTIINANASESSSSLVSSDTSDEECFDMLNAFGQSGTNTPPVLKPSTGKLRRLGSIKEMDVYNSNRDNATLKYKTIIEPEKRSFRQRLSSMFSSKPSPRGVASSNASTYSRGTRMSGVHQSVSDLLSINTVETKGSGFSGFSFMTSSKRRPSMDTRSSSAMSGAKKANKYGGIKTTKYDIWA